MKHGVLGRKRPPLNAIHMEENFQVRYWMQRLSVSRNALDLAVQAVGSDAGAVERFILRAKDRCSVEAKDKTFPLVAVSGTRRGAARTECALARPDQLLRLQYVSRAAPGVGIDGVKEIVAWSTAFNARALVTGALIATGTHFSQVLEGPGAAVQPLMAAIARDPRHCDVRMLYESVVTQRRFGTWAMLLVQDASLQHLIEELWWAQRLDSVRATRLLQHLLYRLQWEPAAEMIPDGPPELRADPSQQPAS